MSTIALHQCYRQCYHEHQDHRTEIRSERMWMRKRERERERELYAFNWKFSTRSISILCLNHRLFCVCVRFAHTTQTHAHTHTTNYARIANEWSMCVNETWIVYCINKQYLTMENDKWSNRKVRCYIAYFNKHKIRRERRAAPGTEP